MQLPPGEPPDALGVERIFQVKASSLDRFEALSRPNGIGCLSDHGTRILALVDEVNGDAADFAAVVEGVPIPVLPGEGGEERRVDVHNPIPAVALEVGNKIWRQQAHETGEADEIDPQGLKQAYHLLLGEDEAGHPVPNLRRRQTSVDALTFYQVGKAIRKGPFGNLGKLLFSVTAVVHDCRRDAMVSSPGETVCPGGAAHYQSDLRLEFPRLDAIDHRLKIGAASRNKDGEDELVGFSGHRAGVSRSRIWRRKQAENLHSP
jgi:hypothetical protein